MSTDAKTQILFAHYLAGRYPAAVPAEMTCQGQGMDNMTITEFAVARALGAHNRELDTMPAAYQIAEAVESLLDGSPRVTIQGKPLPAGRRLEIQVDDGGHSVTVALLGEQNGAAVQHLYAGDDDRAAIDTLLAEVGAPALPPPAPKDAPIGRVGTPADPVMYEMCWLPGNPAPVVGGPVPCEQVRWFHSGKPAGICVPQFIPWGDVSYKFVYAPALAAATEQPAAPAELEARIDDHTAGAHDSTR